MKAASRTTTTRPSSAARGGDEPELARGRWAWLFAGLCLLAFLIVWGSVVIGQRVMAGGDVLYCCAPWSAVAHGRTPHNALVSDGIDQFLPWLELIRQSFASWRLPTWNPYASFGEPLLANGLSAPFSPFNLIAVAFGGAWGMSLAMLLKLWVAAVGAFLYLRSIGTGGLGAVLGGLAFACSSFMIVWLHGEGSAVAALLPWTFAATEWYLRRPNGPRIAALAAAIGLQFLAGQPDASLYLCLGIAVYGLARCLPTPSRAALIGIVAAGVVGFLVAAIQLVPFAEELTRSGLVSSRASAGLGVSRFPLTYLVSWLAPNLRGNPGIDAALGRPPDYNESTGFAGVTALVLAVPGLIALWRRSRPVASGLVLVGLLSVGTVYGPLGGIIGQLPGLASGRDDRMLMLTCFVVACLGGVGLDALVLRGRSLRPDRASLGLLGAGLAAVAAVIVCGLVLWREGAGVDAIGPSLPNQWIVFWVIVGGLSLAAAISLAVAAWRGARGAAIGGLAVLALTEAMIFAGPFQPELPPSQVPPPSAAMRWLEAHAGGGAIAAQGLDLLPETSDLYHLYDARGYDQTVTPRQSIFWTHADPDFTDAATITELQRPGARWLAAAGVVYYMRDGSKPLPGTTVVYRGRGFVISRVPKARPFAFAPTSVKRVGSPGQAAKEMSKNPLSTVYVEGSTPARHGKATVHVVSRRAGRVALAVRAKRPSTVVILQSYTPDWTATVGGRAVDVDPADVLFQSVRVPAGRHRVVLTYSPPSVAWGAWITGGGVALLVALCLWDPFRNALRAKRSANRR